MSASGGNRGLAETLTCVGIHSPCHKAQRADFVQVERLGIEGRRPLSHRGGKSKQTMATFPSVGLKNH